MGLDAFEVLRLLDIALRGLGFLKVLPFGGLFDQQPFEAAVVIGVNFVFQVIKAGLEHPLAITNHDRPLRTRLLDFLLCRQDLVKTFISASDLQGIYPLLGCLRVAFEAGKGAFHLLVTFGGDHCQSATDVPGAH